MLMVFNGALTAGAASAYMIASGWGIDSETAVDAQGTLALALCASS